MFFSQHEVINAIMAMLSGAQTSYQKLLPGATGIAVEITDKDNVLILRVVGVSGAQRFIVTIQPEQ